MKESANLDLLRTVAVLCVVLSHAIGLSSDVSKHALTNLGQCGVLLFFVHTSLVLMMSLERSGNSWSQFMIRRIFRIYPLAILTVAFLLMTGIPSMVIHRTITDIPLTKLDVVSNFLLTQNLTYSPAIPGPLWSLPYELQMYCVLPFLFLLAQKASLRLMLGVWLTAVALALVYPHVPMTGRFNVLDFAPCFVPGVIAYSQRQRLKRIPTLVWPALVIGTVLVYLLLPSTLPYKWLMCLWMGLAIPHFMELSNSLVNRITHWIAKYSYGIYLGHVICLWLAFVRLHWLPVVAQYTLALSLTAALSYVLFHVVESPMIKLGIRLSSVKSKVVPALTTKAKLAGAG